MSRKKSTGATAPGSEHIVRTLNEIDEVKKKINLKERSLKTIDKRVSSEEQENESMIHALRLEIQNLREEFNQSLRKDQDICLQVFSPRSKKSTLAFRRKSVEKVTENIDLAICNTKRHWNILKHVKSKREQKLASLKRMERMVEEKGLGQPEMEDVTVKFNLENSLDKVKQKVITANKIRDIYMEVLKKLQKDVRLYPRKLSALEKDKALLDQENIDIRQVHYNAMTEVEAVLREKKEIEEKVRISKKEREDTLRQLKQTIKEYDPQFDEQRKTSFQLNKKPKRLPAENKRDSDEGRKALDQDNASPDKIDEYENQANLLKSVTGIPFWNCNKMLWCLKNQMDISSDLQKQSNEKFDKVRTLQNTRAELMEELDKIKYFDDRSFQAKVEELKSEVETNRALVKKRKRLIRKKQELADKAMICNGLILCHLVRTTSSFGIPFSTPIDDIDLEAASKTSLIGRNDLLESCQTKIDNKFDLLAESIVTLNEDANKQLEEFSLTAAEVLEQPLTSQLDQVTLKNDNNIRIPAELELKLSEDFDHYYANNDEYISRDLIKRNASLAVRMSRRRA